MFKFHYLDANCLVKLVVEEESSDILRNHCNKQGIVCVTTNFCFYEALGVLKTKWVNKKRIDHISEDEYILACEELCSLIEDEKIQIEEISFYNRKSFSESEKITKEYKIDLSDSFQLFTIKEGMMANLKTPIIPVLISEDKEIFKAAILEGLKVLRINELENA